MTIEYADELWAWVTEINGKPSLVGTLVGHLHTPLIFASERTALAAEPYARAHGEALKQPIRLVRFKAEGVVKHLHI